MLQECFQFKLSEDIIPSLIEEPVKSLGRWHRSNVNDKASMKGMLSHVEGALIRSGLPSTYKAWDKTATSFQGYCGLCLWPLFLMWNSRSFGKEYHIFFRRRLSFPKSFLLYWPLQFWKQAIATNHIKSSPDQVERRTRQKTQERWCRNIWDMEGHRIKFPSAPSMIYCQ